MIIIFILYILFGYHSAELLSASGFYLSINDQKFSQSSERDYILTAVAQQPDNYIIYCPVKTSEQNQHQKRLHPPPAQLQGYLAQQAEKIEYVSEQYSQKYAQLNTAESTELNLIKQYTEESAITWSDENNLWRRRSRGRAHAINLTECNKNSINYQTVRVTAQAQTLLKSYDLDATKFTHIEGTIIQQYLHDEIVVIIEQAACLSVKDFNPTIVSFADIACDYNKAGQIAKASILVDFCYAAFDCAKAVADGVVQGVQQSVEMIVNNPIESAVCLLATPVLPYILAFQAGRICGEILGIGIVRVIDPAIGNEMLDEYVGNIKGMLHALQDKMTTLSATDAIKHTAAFGTQIYLQHKCLQGMSAFYQKAEQTAFAVGARLKNVGGATEAIVTTAEGIEIKVASDAVEFTHFKSITDDGASIKNKKKIIGQMNPNSPDNKVIKSITIDPTSKGIIKKFDITRKMLEHTFSDDHIKNGILQLGSEEEVINKIIDTIMEADKLNMLQHGFNQIRLTVLNKKFTATAQIKNNTIIMINGFIGHSSRKLGNCIEMP